MAAPLETCTRREQHSVIRFLSSEGVKLNTIHEDTCLSLQQMYEWDRKFKNSVSSVA
jgi:hypothetical protein